MNTNNIKKHFLSQSYIKKNVYLTNTIKSKIIDLNFYSKNEINICEIIKKIPYYFHYFNTIEDYDFININQINEKIVERLSLIDNTKYLIINYKNDNEFVLFHDFFYNIKSPKSFIFYTIDSFSVLLNSLIKLHENNICFFNLSPQNILFIFDKPIIYNFQLSLQVLKLSDSYLINIIKNIEDYTYQPIEIHILFYFVYNDINTISYSFIEEITEKYINNLTILNLFSESYKESYKLKCLMFLKKFINKQKKEIINEIIKYNNKWDVFSFSLIYLHIFGNLLRVFALKEIFISEIIDELSKNIHPDSSKRLTLFETKIIFEKLFDLQLNWEFVEKINFDKMSLLLKELER